MKSIKSLLLLILLINSPNVFALEVVSYSMSRCEASNYKIDPWSFGLDIDTAYLTNDTLTMVGTMLANCGDHNIVRVTSQGDTLNIEFTDTGNVVKCMCWRPFELKFRCPFFPEMTYFRINPTWGNGITYYYPDTTYLTDNTTWTYGNLYSDPIQHIGTLFQYSIQGDTVLDAITYRKIRSNYGFPWGIRESEKKFFVRDLQSPTGKDLLLCDFNLSLGDVVPLEDGPGYLHFGSKVTQVDSITLDNGQRRKRMVIDNEHTWIEGIGDITGLFAPVEPVTICCDHPDIPTQLVCFKQQGSVVYSNQQYCLSDCCAYSDGSGLRSPNLIDADVFVLPETLELIVWMVQDDDPVVFVRLIEPSGRVVRAVPVDKLNKLTLNLVNVTKGVYLVEITTVNGRLLKKIAW